MANRLSALKRIRVLNSLLLDGLSERSVERLVGVSRETVGRLARELGEGAERLHDRLIRDLPCEVVEIFGWRSPVNKTWSNHEGASGSGGGDMYTVVARDASSRW